MSEINNEISEQHAGSLSEKWRAIERELAEDLICAQTEEEVILLATRAAAAMDRWSFAACALILNDGKLLQPWFVFAPTPDGKPKPEPEQKSIEMDADSKLHGHFPDPALLVQAFARDIKTDRLGQAVSWASLVDHPQDEIRVFLVLPSQTEKQPVDDEAAIGLSKYFRAAWKRFCRGLHVGATMFRNMDLLDLATELIQAVDPQGKIGYVNHAWLDTMKMQREAVVGTNVFDHLHESCGQACQEHFGELMRGRTIQGLELTMIDNDGERVELRANCAPHFRHGKVIGVYVFMTNRTAATQQGERMQLLEAALENCDQEIAILDAGIQARDKSVNILFASGAFTRKSTHWARKPLDSNAHGEEPVVDWAAPADLDEALKAASGSDAPPSADSKVAAWKISPVNSATGEITGWVAARNLAANGSGRARSGESTARLLEKVAEASSIPLALLDETGAPRIASGAWSQVFGDSSIDSTKDRAAGFDASRSTSDVLPSEQLKEALAFASENGASTLEIELKRVPNIPDGVYHLHVLRADHEAKPATWIALLAMSPLPAANPASGAFKASALQTRLDAVDSSPEGIAVLMEENYTYVNQSHAAFYGYTPNELIGQSWRRLYSTEEQERIEKLAFQALEENGRWSGQVTGQRKDGSIFDAEITLVMMPAGHLVCCCRDVSSFVRANQALEKNNLLLKELSQLHTQWIASTDTHQVFENLLSAALECSRSKFGFLGETLHDETGAPYLKAHALTNIAWNAETRSLYENAASTGFEFRNLNTLFGCVLISETTVISNNPADDPRSGGTPKGHPPLESFVGIPIKSGGAMIGMIGLANREGGYDNECIQELEPLFPAYSSMIMALRANRERKSAEENLRTRTSQLAAANEELAVAAHLKDRFLANMSHELRTPLSGILNLTEALTEQFYGPINEKQLCSLETIADCGNHLLSLINDILDLAKIDANQTQLQLARCSAREICDYSLRMVEGSRELKDQDLAFSIEGGDFEFSADHRRIAQAVVNLLANAVKFTPDGGKIELEARRIAETEEAVFEVRDSGIGLPEENIDRLFEPFIQLDDGHSKSYAGTGLGLALVHKLVELHGGRVNARNRETGGSEFEIILPIRTANFQSANPGGAAQPATKGPRGSSPANPSEKTVLLVEDNPVNVETVCDYLTGHGFEVYTAGNGAEGVALAKSLVPDVVLMDIQMPVMDGIDAIKKLRKDPNPTISGVPIIALTALAMMSDRDACIEAGATIYLSKPIKLRELTGLIHDCLEKSG